MDAKKIATAIVNYYGTDRQALQKFFSEVADSELDLTPAGSFSQQVVAAVSDIYENMYPSRQLSDDELIALTNYGPRYQ